MDKIAYIIGRILQMIPTVFAIIVLVFLMIHLIPGDPATIMLGLKATPEKIEMLTEHLGLDKPLYIQFGYLPPQPELKGTWGIHWCRVSPSPS